MDDLIKRQDAIDALGERPMVWTDNDDYALGERNQYDMDKLALETVPSEQPDNQVNLCDSCKHTYPDCPSQNDDVIFGNGNGGDNICACAKYVPSVQPEQRWIPCGSELPSDNREVEVTCEVRRCDGKKYRYTCHASYVHKYTIESTDYCDWEGADEYNEDEDKFYALPGWYERVHNWDDYSHLAIADFVTAWRELPEPYREEGGAE